MKASAYSDIAANAHTFTSDGSAFWYAGTSYHWAFAADQWYAFSQAPERFTAAQINNMVTKFIAVKNTNGDLPIALNPDATAFVFFSPNDTVGVTVGGDGWMFVPQMALLAYQKSGSLATFNAVAPSLKIALQRVPLSGGLVNVPTGSEWIPWGFNDGIMYGGGTNLMGSLGFYVATKAMATMYAAAGDSTNAAVFTAYYSNVASALDAAFWNATDGMYHASTGVNNNQIDVNGSAYAVFLGLAPSHANTISTYLVTNYGALTYQGFWRQSNVNWGRFWGSRTHGTYDDGYWSVANRWILSTVAITSPSLAQTAMAAFVNGADPTHEWYNTDFTSAGAATLNLESPQGNYSFAASRPDLYFCTSAVLRGKIGLRGLATVR